MAGVGLQTLSAVDQRVQVDTNNRTMMLLKSGQFTAANGQEQAWVNEQANIVGLMTPSAVMCYRASAPGIHPSIGSYRNGKKYVNFTYIKGQSVTFQYYIFDLMAPSLTSRLGLQSFDANGNLIYDAMDYPMKILGFFSTDFEQGVNRTVYVAEHPNIAVASLGGGHTVQFYETDSESRSSYLFMQGNNIVKWGLYDPNPEGWISIPQYGSYGTNLMSALVVDTTNLPNNFLRN